MPDAAYKLVIAMTTREGIAPEEFVNGWRAATDVEPDRPAGLLDSTLDAPSSMPAPITNVAASPFDAAWESWWSRKNDAADWIVSRDFQEGWLPRRLSLLAGLPTAVGGVPQLLWETEQASAPGAVKIVVLPVAARRLRFQEFVAHWTVDHARLALASPGIGERLIRLEDTPAPIPSTSRLARGRYDGVGTLTFASAEALAAEFEGDYYRDVLTVDESRFTDPAFSAAFVTIEHPSL
jgi:hypothetical protein